MNLSFRSSRQWAGRLPRQGLPWLAHRLVRGVLYATAMLGMACGLRASGLNWPDQASSPPTGTNLTSQVTASSPATTNAMLDVLTNGMEALDDKYRLAVGDSINFQIVEDEGDPQPLTVTDSGDVEVPYIGRYPAAGKTCKQLARELKTELEKKYYYRATVIISVKSMVSAGVVYLEGGVKSPGPLEMPRDDVLTVSKAILRAGGFDDFADQKHVRVTRQGENGTNEVFTVNVAAVLNRGHVEDDQQVEPGDLIFVPEKTINW